MIIPKDYKLSKSFLNNSGLLESKKVTVRRYEFSPSEVRKGITTTDGTVFYPLFKLPLNDVVLDVHGYYVDDVEDRKVPAGGVIKLASSTDIELGQTGSTTVTFGDSTISIVNGRSTSVGSGLSRGAVLSTGGNDYYVGVINETGQMGVIADEGAEFRCVIGVVTVSQTITDGRGIEDGFYRQ